MTYGNEYCKYTLYCEPGVLFHSKKHYLFVGDWLPYDNSYVILCHGKLSPVEYHQFMGQDKINIFEDVLTKTVAIYNRITAGYLNKLGTKGKTIESCISYVGCLDRDVVNHNLWKGEVHRK